MQRLAKGTCHHWKEGRKPPGAVKSKKLGVSRRSIDERRGIRDARAKLLVAARPARRSGRQDYQLVSKNGVAAKNVGYFCPFFAAIFARPLMQFMPSEHQAPFPFMRLAEACDEMIGDGIERMAMASASDAKTDRIHFMTSFLLVIERVKIRPGRRQYFATTAAPFQS
jgi:hypothetical protein